MIRIITVVCICVLLGGCATKTRFFVYDYDTEILREVGRIEQQAKGAASIEHGDRKMVVDTRQPSSFERFIKPLFQGVTQGARANVEAK